MIGSRLRELRKAKKMTQAKLASMLNVDITLIGKWEIHNVTPGAETLNELVRIFEVTSDYLLGGSDTPNIEQTPPENSESAKALAALRSLGLSPTDLEKLSPEKKELFKEIAKTFIQERQK